MKTAAPDRAAIFTSGDGMGTRVAVVGLLLTGMLVLAALQPATILRVETAEGDSVLCQEVKPGTPITLTFTHSMYGGDVDETWILDADGQLVRQRIVTDNAAAAEYYATDGQVERQGARFTILAGPLALDELIVRVDSIGNHRLTVGTTTWHLGEILTGPVQVRLTGERISRIRVPDACVTPASELHTEDTHA